MLESIQIGAESEGPMLCLLYHMCLLGLKNGDCNKYNVKKALKSLYSVSLRELGVQSAKVLKVCFLCLIWYLDQNL